MLELIIGLSLAGIWLSPDLKIGTTLAIFRLPGKTPSHMLSFITYDRSGASKILTISKCALEYHRVHMIF